MQSFQSEHLGRGEMLEPTSKSRQRPDITQIVGTRRTGAFLEVLYSSIEKSHVAGKDDSYLHVLYSS